MVEQASQRLWWFAARLGRKRRRRAAMRTVEGASEAQADSLAVVKRRICFDPGRATARDGVMRQVESQCGAGGVVVL